MSEEALKQRQQAFDEFKRGVFNILKCALAYDLDRGFCRECERTIRISMPPAARSEMLAYTDTTEITVTGSQRRVGWFFNTRVHKHITADIIFNPYRMTLSAWTDPKAEGGIVCFA